MCDEPELFEPSRRFEPKRDGFNPLESVSGINGEFYHNKSRLPRRIGRVHSYNLGSRSSFSLSLEYHDALARVHDDAAAVVVERVLDVRLEVHQHAVADLHFGLDEAAGFAFAAGLNPLARPDIQDAVLSLIVLICPGPVRIGEQMNPARAYGVRRLERGRENVGCDKAHFSPSRSG